MCTCRRHYPGAAAGRTRRSYSPSRVSLPRFHVRVGLHIDLFEACSAFTHVAACTLARSPYVVTAIRRLQAFRLLHACSGCFRLERLPGGVCTHWKCAALSRRTWKSVIGPMPTTGHQRACECAASYRPVARPLAAITASAVNASSLVLGVTRGVSRNHAEDVSHSILKPGGVTRSPVAGSRLTPAN